MNTAIKGVIVSVLLVECVLAQTTLPAYSPMLTTFTDPNTPVSTTQANAIFDLATGTFRGQTEAAQFLQLTAAHVDSTLSVNNSKTYVIIHIVRWSDVDGGQSQSPGSSRWYIYNPSPTWDSAAFSSNNRLFGVPRFWLVTVQLNLRYGPPLFTLNYQITVNHRLPLNIQHLADLVKTANPAAAAPGGPPPIPPSVDYWASEIVTGANPPSDISIVPQATVNGTGTKLDNKTVVFDNEGLYHWDVSIGVPVKSYKQIQQIAPVVNSNTTLPASVDRRSLLALGDIYVKPVDLKTQTLISTPYFVGGISLASKPLSSIMAGLGWGPTIANFYVGAMIVTNKNQNTGKKTIDSSLAFGINIPVRMILGKSGLNTQVH